MKSNELKIGGAILLTLAVIGFAASAFALTDQHSEKELWAKQHAASLDARTIDPPVILEHGGPDAGGYYFIDSDDDAANTPVYNWIDITGFGNNLGITNDDQIVGPLSIGFTFNYYGLDKTQISVSSNGWAGFGSFTSYYYNNVAIPTPAAPNDILPVFWDDLHPRSNGVAYMYTNNIDSCIISWVNFDRFSPQGSSYTFQIILTGNGNVYYQYASLTGTLNSHTIGIENGDGTIGLQYVFNTQRDESESAIYFGLTPPIYSDHDVKPLSFISPLGYARVGTPLSPQVRFMNAGTSSESFVGRVIVNHNGTIYNQSQQINDLAPTATVDVAFPDFTPAEEGAFEFVAITELPGDGVPGNDTLRNIIQAYAHIYFEDFEAGDGFFVGDNDWQWGIPTSGPNGAHSGVNLWATILGGNYTIGPLLSTLTSPPLGLGSGAVLTFWHWYDTENLFDGGNVKISTDGGGSWAIIIPAGGYDGTLSSNFQNPIGGEEAFYGRSNGWLMETFDLSAYGGMSVTIKLDFGSDSSVDGVGWYVDDFTIIGGGGVNPGWVAGTVTDLASGNPISGATVTVASRVDTTDVSGHYILELFPGTYAVTASAQYHNDLTVNGVVIAEGDTTTQNFALTAPVIQVNTTPIDTAIQQGQTAVFTRSITNTGNGPLNYNVNVSLGGRLLTSGVRVEVAEQTAAVGERNARPEISDIAPNFQPGEPPSIQNFGDELFTFDPQTPTGDEACLGIEFDGDHFWVTGRHPVDDVHKLHKFDRNGNYLESFDQGTTTTWGWRDLTFDGTNLYGSDENEFAQIDPATGQKIGTLPMPGGFTPPLRGLAYDPATDHFWTANFGSNIIEFDRAGQVINTYTNIKAIYGLAWDDVSEGGPWLWTFSQDGAPATEVSQFDPSTGQYTGIGFFALDHNGGNDDLAGGACFTTEWNPSFGVLFCLVQGQYNSQSFDLAQGYEITPYSNWLVVNPTSGTLAPAQSVNLSITVDFTGQNIVPDSNYVATITINSNAQGTPPQIPVTSHVNPTGLDDPGSSLPATYSLSRNYPNPFNPATEIEFGLPTASDVRLEVFNILGQRIDMLVNGLLPAGYHSVTWNAASQASGIYFYKITAGNFSQIHQMTLLK